jgi:hypothetical protein
MYGGPDYPDALVGEFVVFEGQDLLAADLSWNEIFLIELVELLWIHLLSIYKKHKMG